MVGGLFLIADGLGDEVRHIVGGEFIAVRFGGIGKLVPAASAAGAGFVDNIDGGADAAFARFAGGGRGNIARLIIGCPAGTVGNVEQNGPFGIFGIRGQSDSQRRKSEQGRQQSGANITERFFHFLVLLLLCETDFHSSNKKQKRQKKYQLNTHIVMPFFVITAPFPSFPRRRESTLRRAQTPSAAKPPRIRRGFYIPVILAPEGRGNPSAIMRKHYRQFNVAAALPPVINGRQSRPAHSRIFPHCYAMRFALRANSKNAAIIANAIMSPLSRRWIPAVARMTATPS